MTCCVQMKLNLTLLSRMSDFTLKLISPLPPPFRRDRDKNGGGKMIFIRECLIAKRLRDSTKIAPLKLIAWKPQFLKKKVCNFCLQVTM